jgi:hypothetical protein
MSMVNNTLSLVATTAAVMYGARAVTQAFQLAFKVGSTVVGKRGETATQFMGVVYAGALARCQSTLPFVFGKLPTTDAEKAQATSVQTVAEQNAAKIAGARKTLEPSYQQLIGKIALSVILAAAFQVIANRYAPHELFNQRLSWLAPLSLNSGRHPAIEMFSAWYSPKA